MRASISDQMTEAEELNEYRMSNKEFRMMKFDGHLRKPKRPFSVTPAKAGVQYTHRLIKHLDSGFHRSDDFLKTHQDYFLDPLLRRSLFVVRPARYAPKQI
jgi:hypothetical protein